MENVEEGRELGGRGVERVLGGGWCEENVRRQNTTARRSEEVRLG